MIENKKASIIMILKVLEEYSDDEHFLTYQDIISHVFQLYNITLERKSVAYSLYLLQELGYEVIKSPKGGVALLTRAFEKCEVQFLIDALLSSKSINGKQAYELADKINSTLSKYQRKDYSYIYKSNQINRSDNNEIFYTLEIIEEAKKLGKRISFEYISYDDNGNIIKRMDGYRYIVSPYYSINSNGRYYLICNYREKYHDIQVFRLDYITNVRIESEWPIKPLNSLKSTKDFDISKYINENIYLLDGPIIDATILIENKDSIHFIIDYFGNNARIYKKNDKLYADIKCNENALFYWYMQYSETMTIISPRSFIERVKNEAYKIFNKY